MLRRSLLGLLVGTLLACGDNASSDAGNDTDVTGGLTSSSTSDAATPTASLESTAAPTDAPDSSDSDPTDGVSTWSEDDTGTGGQTCADVDCSGHGTCS
ncbi:MAG: hypothetical protein JKY37_09895, partial [Nannocystaceae bacterium]|nr:hypothetical protein [Nannocystaceae bacterium]